MSVERLSSVSPPAMPVQSSPLQPPASSTYHASPSPVERPDVDTPQPASDEDDEPAAKTPQPAVVDVVHKLSVAAMRELLDNAKV